MTWGIYTSRDLTVTEIIPMGDEFQHETGGFCWCAPEIVENNGVLIVTHNAADGRDGNNGDTKWRRVQ